MTIERLPSGSYRLTEMYNGRRYRCTIDHRPSKIEAREIMQDKIVGFNNGSSFKRGAEEYIKSKINISDSFWCMILGNLINIRLQNRQSDLIQRNGFKVRVEIS